MTEFPQKHIVRFPNSKFLGTHKSHKYAISRSFLQIWGFSQKRISPKITCHGANLVILEKANSRTLSFSPFLLALSPFPSHFFFFFLFLSDPTGQLLI